jgi:membrane protein
MAGWSRTRAVAFAKELSSRLRRHNLTLVAAGTAFYAFLALIPGLIAFVSVYGLIADPAEVQEQVNSVAGALPKEVERFLEFQLTSIIKAGSAEISVTLVVALVIALWSASIGMAALLSGIQVAHERPEPLGYVKKRARALVLTIAAIVFVVLVIGVAAFLPALADEVLGETGTLVVEILRWPVLAVVMVVGLGLLYRFADPERSRGWLGFVSRGAVVATVVWLLASMLFSIYTSSFASYSRTYGSLAAIVVLLFWLFLSSFAVLVGAEVDTMD